MTPEKIRELSLFTEFFPLLKYVISLGQAAETMLPYRQNYKPFLQEAEDLVRKFPSLCEAGDADEIRRIFQNVLLSMRAAQLKDAESTVN